MKKFKTLILIVLMSLFLFSCKIVKSYDDLSLEFAQHLEKANSNYVNKILNFNQLTDDVFLSIVKVDLVFKHATGVIFQFDENYYYILTNAHIVYTEEENIEFLVYDVYDNPYEAQIIDISLEHDLAILKIEKTIDLKVAIFNKTNSLKDDETIMIGFHGFQKNAVTYGKVLMFDKIDIATNGNIHMNFISMITNNPIKSGSSGSIVVNEEGILIGLLYAGSFNDNSSVAKYAFSIPVEIIIDYLNQNNFTPIFKEDLS